MKAKSVIKKSAMIPTALIAGGAGFVSSYLSEALLNKGARVIVLDNFKTGKQSYVNHLLTNPNFALFDCDINEALPEELVSVDYVFHLAGLEEYSYVKEVMDLTSLLTNAVGTKNLLDITKRSESKLLLLSTTDVYEGRMSQLELSEYFGRSKIEENRYMLAEAKRYAEALVWEYYKKNDIDVRIVRVPEVYGPRMNLMSTGNLGRFVSDLIAGRELTIYGEGDEKEFYLYVEDAVAGVLKSMYNDKTKGNIFSLVPHEPVTVLELAYMLKSVADRGVEVKFEDIKPDNYVRRGILKMPDTFNLQLLKWEPKISLRDGLVKSLQAFNYSANQYSFKPAKLIDQRKAEKAAQASFSEVTEHSENLFSLSDVKEVKPPIESKDSSIILPRREPPVIVQAGASGANFVQQSSFSLPTVKLPSVNLPSLPKINLPKIPLPKVPAHHASKIYMVLALLLPALLIFIGLPLMSFYVNAKSAVESLKSVKESANIFSTNDIKDNARNSYESFYKANRSLVNLRPVFYISGKQDEYKSLTNLLSSLTNFSKAVYSGAKGTAPLENLWEVIRPDTLDEINSAQFVESKTHLESARSSIQLAQVDFKYVSKAHLPVKYQPFYDEYAKILSHSGEGFDIAIPLFGSLPELLGSNTQKKYLLLFQNSNEIRATGGFIGSYGLLTLDKGKIKDLLIDDIYNPDGQIDQRNIVSPLPKPIEDFLNEDKLHLRNANWNPDFPVSANTIEDLYFKVTGERMDGVIAIDLYFIQNILRATGPIFLSAYNEEVTAENVYERAEMHSEFNYTEGSNQKRAFLTVLSSKLMERLFSLDRSHLPQLADAFMKSLNEKHLLVSLSNDPINHFLKENRWDGSLHDTAEDYLYVVDSNVGGTKANYYVKKQMNYTVSSLTRDGLLRATVQLEYQHTGKDTAWPGGPYKNYLRVLAQHGAKLTGANIKFNDGPSEGIFEKIITSNEGKYASFETDFTLQPQGKVVVTLNYDLSSDLSLNKDHRNYELFWQKQPGTQDEKAKFVMNKPFGFQISELSPNITSTDDNLEASSVLNEDTFYYVKLH